MVSRIKKRKTLRKRSVDFTKRQLVVNRKNGVVILTDGTIHGNDFGGTVVHYPNMPMNIGMHATTWPQVQYVPFQENMDVMLSQ